MTFCLGQIKGAQSTIQSTDQMRYLMTGGICVQQSTEISSWECFDSSICVFVCTCIQSVQRCSSMYCGKVQRSTYILKDITSESIQCLHFFTRTTTNRTRRSGAYVGWSTTNFCGLDSTLLYYISQVIWVSKQKSKYPYQRDHLVGQSTSGRMEGRREWEECHEEKVRDW